MVLIITNVCAIFSLFLLMVLNGKWKARQGLPTAGLLRHHLHLPHKMEFAEEGGKKTQTKGELWNANRVISGIVTKHKQFPVRTYVDINKSFFFYDVSCDFIF